MPRRAVVGVLALLLSAAVFSGAQQFRFMDNADGTVTDSHTGLMWQRCPAGLSGAECTVGSVGLYTWAEALASCEDLVLPPGAHTDWRLPDIKELASIVDYTRYAPAIDVEAFPDGAGAYSNPHRYWSSSTVVSSPRTDLSDRACSVYSEYGDVNWSNKTEAYHVRCVR